jgi:hypothetical protein
MIEPLIFMKNFSKRAVSLLFVCLLSTVGHGELAVTISSPKVTGQKAVVPLVMQNHFNQKIESARASVFLLDEKGKMVGQSTKWVIGGIKNQSSLAPGGTNSFFFVITSDKPFATTNLTVKLNFNRVVLDGGKLADAGKDVEIRK